MCFYFYCECVFVGYDGFLIVFILFFQFFECLVFLAFFFGGEKFYSEVGVVGV